MSLDHEAQERLDQDIDQMDEITLLAADILYELDRDLIRGKFDANEFRAKILRDFPLDETRRMLFERAFEKYRKAIEETSKGLADPGAFLASTKLQLDQYEGLRASVDPRRPGVVVIHLKSRADAVQFDTDITDDVQSKLKAMTESFGGTFIRVGREKGSFIGKSVKLSDLGLSANLPLLGVIVVCDDAGEDEEVQGVTNHEYAHAIFNGLVTPFLHRYFSGVDRKNWPAQLPQGSREKLLAALGDVSTLQSDQYETETGELSDFERQLRSRYGSNNVMSLPEKKESELNSALAEEQFILNEMRAYGFSHPGLPPTFEMTPLKIRKPSRLREIGVMDPKMVKRLFELHVLVTKAAYSNREVFLGTQSILGASQSLDQAKRLVKNFLDSQKQLFSRAVDLDSFLNLVGQFSAGELRGLFEYSVSGESILDEQEVLRSLLPPKEMLIEAARTFYGEPFPENVQTVLGLY